MLPRHTSWKCHKNQEVFTVCIALTSYHSLQSLHKSPIIPAEETSHSCVLVAEYGKDSTGCSEKAHLSPPKKLKYRGLTLPLCPLCQCLAPQGVPSCLLSPPCVFLGAPCVLKSWVGSKELSAVSPIELHIHPQVLAFSLVLCR